MPNALQSKQPGSGRESLLFSVWPSSDRLAFFDDVSASYAAAADLDGRTCCFRR